MEPVVVFLAGRFVESLEQARVSLFDRGYLLGDSVFETLRAYNGMPFRQESHLARLEHSAEVVGIRIPEPRHEIERHAHEALSRSGLREAYLRITVSRGEGPGGIGSSGYDAPVLSIVVRPLRPYPANAYEHGIASKVAATRKVPAACLDPTIKCGNYLPSILARRELERQGVIEGVQRAVEGHVVGGTVSNVFLIERNRLRTPDAQSGILLGITRAALIEVASQAGLEVAEERLEVADLRRADEMFFANTLMECLPVRAIGEHEFASAPGPRTQAIHRAFRDLVERETRGELAS